MFDSIRHLGLGEVLELMGAICLSRAGGARTQGLGKYMVKYPYAPERKQNYIFNTRTPLAYDEYISFSAIAVVPPAIPVLYYGCGVSIPLLHRERGDCKQLEGQA